MRRARSFAGIGFAVLVGAAIYVRCFHPIYAMNVGLDSSWSLGLAEAAAKHLGFGRDIVFTFGPLGYLVVGTALPENNGQRIAFQMVLAVLIALLAAWHVLVARSALQKAAFAVLLLLLTGLRSTVDDLTMLALLLTWTSPVFRRPVVAPGWAFALGAFSGFVSLTKFTVGIEAWAGGLLVLGYKVFATRYDVTGRTTNVRALAAFVLAFAALGLWLPAATTLGPFVAAVFGAISFAGALCYAMSRAVWSRWAMLTGALGALALAATKSSLTYVGASLQLSRGYSAAMSIPGPAWQLEVALTLGAICLILLIGNRRSLTPGVALALACTLFLSFKEGFVRQDGHVVAFFTECVALATIATSVAADGRSFAAASLAAAMSLLTMQAALDSFAGAHQPMYALLDPFRVAGEFAHAFSPQPDAKAVGETLATGLAPDALPANVTRTLATGTVDVLPWESNVVFANGLPWQPEPVFQTYAAYTPGLDRLNAASVDAHGADHVLYAWQGIDGRYPLWDEPATFREIACRYRLDKRYAQPVTTSGGLRFLVLQKAPKRCSTSKTQNATAIWRAPLAIPTTGGALTFASIHIRYSPLGRLLDTLYRVPPIFLKITDASGNDEYARVLGEVTADGILVNPLPQDIGGFAALLRGNTAGMSRTMTLESESLWYFQPDAAVTFEMVPYR